MCVKISPVVEVEGEVSQSVNRCVNF
jgi:hypothetical protein